VKGNRLDRCISGNGVRVKQGYAFKILIESIVPGARSGQLPQGFQGVKDSLSVGMHRM